MNVSDGEEERRRRERERSCWLCFKELELEDGDLLAMPMMIRRERARLNLF